MTAVTAPATTDQHHPVVESQKSDRTANLQLRVADVITKFAGNMLFVYIHIGLFGAWIATNGLGLKSDPYPYAFLTLIVSLEAIFLSTFVMIGQNRQASFQQAKADHDFQVQDLELKTNTDLTREIHTLTSELHRRLVPPEVGPAAG